jgi:hypothetical protein
MHTAEHHHQRISSISGKFQVFAFEVDLSSSSKHFSFVKESYIRPSSLVFDHM